MTADTDKPDASAVPAQPTAADVCSLLSRHRILELEPAARMLGTSPPALVKLALAHPDRLGYLVGPPAVLFERVPAEPASD